MAQLRTVTFLIAVLAQLTLLLFANHVVTGFSLHPSSSSSSFSESSAARQAPVSTRLRRDGVSGSPPRQSVLAITDDDDAASPASASAAASSLSSSSSVQEGGSSGPSRSEIVRAWLRAMFSRAADLRRRQEAAADGASATSALEDADRWTLVRAVDGRPTKDVLDFEAAPSSASSGSGRHGGLGGLGGGDWLGRQRRNWMDNDDVLMFDYDKRPILSKLSGAASSSTDHYPIVLRKRNLCCSLDLYCANCDDQRRRKRTV
jgi:hypothetical protein